MLGAILTTVLGGLVLTGLIALLKTHWLYVIVPKPYLNTPLSSGQVISLSIVNLGLPLEEDIRIRFRSVGHFEMIASSTSAVTFANNTISLPRLSRFDTVTVHILVEGKAFDLTDVETVEAKSTTGKVVEKKEKATSLWTYLVVLPLLVLILVFPFALGTVIGRDSGASAFQYVESVLESFGSSKQLAGYKVGEKEPYASIAGSLANVTAHGKVQLHLDEIVRHGDILDITLTVSNHLSSTLVVDADATASAPDSGPLDFTDVRIPTTFVPPGGSQTRRLKAYLPESSNPRVVLITYRLKLGNDTDTVEQTITF